MKDIMKLTPVDSIPTPGYRESIYLVMLQEFINSDMAQCKVDIDTGASIVPSWKTQDAYAKLKYQTMKHNLPVSVWYRKGEVYLEKKG